MQAFKHIFFVYSFVVLEIFFNKLTVKLLRSHVYSDCLFHCVINNTDEAQT